MEEALWFGFVILLIVVASAFAIRRQRARVRKAWGEVAARLGGTFVPASGMGWRSQSGRVEARIGASSVVMDHFMVSHGKHATLYTRTRVATLCSKRLRSYRKTIFSGIGKALGMQDLVVGDPIYDDLFIIQSDDEMWARSVLHDLLIKEHVRAPMLQLHVKDGWVETIQAGYDYDVDRLERRMRMTAALALSVEAQP